MTAPAAIFLVLFVAFVAWLVWLAARAVSAPTLNEAVAQGVATAINEASAPGGAIEQALCDSLRRLARENRPIAGQLAWTPFAWQIAFEFIRVGDMHPWAARDLAVSTLRNMLRDEKISFGDPNHDWSQDAARVIAHEMEIDHWETRQ